MNRIGENIRKLRNLKGYSQEYLSKKLKMSQNNYSELERGKVKLTIERLNEIAQILEVKPEDILNFDGGFSFKNKNHKGGNQISVNMFSEKIIESYEKRIQELKDQNNHLKERNNVLKNSISKIILINLRFYRLY